MLINGLNSTLLQTILDGINTLLAGEQGVQTFFTTRVELDKLYNQIVRAELNGVALPAARITAGTHSLYRIRGGTTTAITTGAASSKADGIVLAGITYDANWDVGDVFQLTFTGIKLLASDETTVLEEFPDIHVYGQVVSLADVSTDVMAIRAEVEDADHGLENIKDLVVAVGTTVQAFEQTLNNAGTGKLWIVDQKVDVIDGNVDDIEAILTHGTYGNAALNTDLDQLLTYTDILDDATNGNAAIRTQVNAANTSLALEAARLGTVLLNNPAADASVTGWLTNSGYSVSRDTSTYRTSPASIKATLTANQSGTTGIYYTMTGKAKRYGRYYASMWVLSATASLQIRAGIFSSAYTNNRYFGNAVTVSANTWTKIEGVATLDNASDSGDLSIRIGTVNGLDTQSFFVDDLVLVELDGTFDDYTWRDIDTDLAAAKTVIDNTYAIANHATYGNANLKTVLDTKASPADVLGRLNLAVDASNAPTAKSLRDILHKDSSYTYSKSSHSLEAIGNDTDAIIDYVKAGRSAYSGSTTMTGSEQTLYEQAHTGDWEFKGGWIDLRNLADTRAVVIKVYIKMESGGSYIEVASATFTGSADAKVYPCPASFPIGGSTVKVVVPSWWNRYGVKVTAQQTVLGGGYITVKHEWFDGRS